MHLQISNNIMLLHPSDNYTERFMWRRGERTEAASVGRLTLLVAGKRSLVFDVGANCGVYTIALSDAAASDSRIVAFEPNPIMANRLRKNLALNNLDHIVEIEEVAIGQKNDTAHLHLSKADLGRASIITDKNSTSTPVRVRTLATYLPEKHQKFDIFVVKIDAEGYEDRALVPFLTSIKQKNMPDAILIETRHAESWSLDLMEVLTNNGYVSFFEGEDHNTLFVRHENLQRRNS